MAYLRDEKEKLEIDFSLGKVWAAISKAVKELEWTIQEQNNSDYKLKIKTKPGFLAYSSIFHIEVNSVDENKTHMTVYAETPVTTITAMADFGRTRDRIDRFIEALAKQMNKEKNKQLTAQKNTDNKDKEHSHQ
ncbi:MAG: hypothetical protein GX648_07725 [Crenarchaeota archaeon]|nr:hypothetical protein [Thermoproteota archaeon]